MLGVIAANLDLNKISSMLKEKKIPFDGDFLISTYDGRVVVSPNVREALKNRIPQEWVEKINGTHGHFYDKKNSIVFYKIYSNPDWVAFTSVDKEKQEKYYESSYLLFYITSVISLLILGVLYFLYISYSKRLFGKFYLGLNGFDVSSSSFNFDSLESEISKHRTKLNIVKHETVTDSMTQLFNRKKLDDDISLLISERKEFCFAMIDLDDFKLINDSFGHLIGDDVLKFVAREGKRILGVENPLYRVGGEEIIVIFSDKDLQTCISLLNAWRLQVNERQWKEPSLKVSFSGGITIYEYGDYLTDLISRADKALYNAKKNGKNMIISS
ncbi:diguanylate cyclase [Kluyvera sp. 142486]|uniref:sensor domain-containing diguanylate cyclase n=1 Tax=Kluyvera sp. 142486 TaxID=3390050 RepID=UPI00397F7BF8